MGDRKDNGHCSASLDLLAAAVLSRGGIVLFPLLFIFRVSVRSPLFPGEISFTGKGGV